MDNQQALFETPKLALNRIEAAKALSVSPATLDRLANRGLIFPCRATGRPLYAITEIERFLRETADVVSV
jgi:Helix-turn-helix domain